MTDRELLELLVAKISNIEANQNGMVAKLSDIEQKMSQVEQRLFSVEQKVTGVEERLSAVEERLSAGEEKVIRIEGKQNTIIEQTAFLAEYRTDNAEKVADLERRVRQNTTDLAILKKVAAK
ncbi:MAG: hypothetical protein ACOWWO_01660 [Peptococcaceae bacterium]